MAEIVVLNGVCAGTVFALPEIPTVVGRSPESHLRMGDPWISNMHALFERRGAELWVVDLDSRNGTFVNDERVSEARVPDGGIVRFGKTQVRVATMRPGIDATPLPLGERSGPNLVERAFLGATLSMYKPHLPEREPLADPYALAFRPATVLRMSIDATVMGELPEASERLRAALAESSETAVDAGAVVARLAGVGVLAIFGLTGPRQDDPEHAIAAARTSRLAVRSRGGLELRAAVDAGPVLAGNADSSGGFELAALGPVAERAERLLALARSGEILVGPGAARVEGLVRVGLRSIGGAEVEVFREERE